MIAKQSKQLFDLGWPQQCLLKHITYIMQPSDIRPREFTRLQDWNVV